MSPGQEKWLSVVIPTLNESASLAEAVASARRCAGFLECLVVDAGSTDGTPALAAGLGCEMISSVPLRGRQLGEGALRAKGDVVLFLHADTRLPAGAGEAIQKLFKDPATVAGGFHKTFLDSPWFLPGARMRSKMAFYLTGAVWGDQALFVRRKTLLEVGGVPAVPLMEEFELCRRLKRKGRIRLVPEQVTTSFRRFQKNGILKTYWRMASILILYRLGTPPAKLASLYQRDRA